MRLDVLLEVLRSLEGLATALTSMWFERHMDPDVRCDMIPRTISKGPHRLAPDGPFHSSNLAFTPCARQIEVVR